MTDTILTAQTWIKAPDEVEFYGMDFSARMGVGETLADVTSVTCTVESGGGGTPDDLTLGSPSFSNSTQIATVEISRGKPGVTYRLEFLVTTTTAGRVLRSDGLLTVSDS